MDILPVNVFQEIQPRHFSLDILKNVFFFAKQQHTMTIQRGEFDKKISVGKQEEEVRKGRKRNDAISLLFVF